ncbi:MAG TPA: autotransporter outer membrane beta-barrel domain-containing protein, partial [Devosia sp.]
GRLNFNHTDANYMFSTVVSGAGTINHVAGFTNLTGNSSGFTGNTSVQGGTLAVNGSLCGGMNVLSGGRLQGNGTVCDTTNTGTIAPGNSIGTLTINGNYVGNGGLLEIEAILGGDASPTDLLVVTGDTSGSTNVRVINVGGAGGKTAEGIKIVQVDGASDSAAFSLLGDYLFQGEQAVVGGAYAYRLYQGSVSAPADGDWYLRSTLIQNDPASGPIFQAGVPLYEVYGDVLQQSFASLETMRQRIGSRVWTGAPDTVDGKGLWGRLVVDHAHLAPLSSTSGPGYDVNTWRLQAGTDSMVAATEGGMLVAGLHVDLGTVSADVSSFYGSGSISSFALGGGATLTYLDDSGFYLDAQAQLKGFSSTLSSQTAGLSLVTGSGGAAYGLSLEAGQKLALGDAFSLTPQGQIAFGSAHINDFTDAFGATVSGGHAERLTGRLGLSADYETEWTDAAGEAGRTHFYGLANLYYDFSQSGGATVGGTHVASTYDPLQAGVSLGGSVDWAGDRLSLYGEVNAMTGLRSFGDSYSLGATAGIRGKF